MFSGFEVLLESCLRPDVQPSGGTEGGSAPSPDGSPGNVAAVRLDCLGDVPAALLPAGGLQGSQPAAAVLRCFARYATWFEAAAGTQCWRRLISASLPVLVILSGWPADPDFRGFSAYFTHPNPRSAENTSSNPQSGARNERKIKKAALAGVQGGAVGLISIP